MPSSGKLPYTLPDQPKGTQHRQRRTPAVLQNSILVKECLTIDDLYGETLLMGERGVSTSADSIRDIVERHPAVKIEDTPRFYDIEVFNRCAQTQTVLLTLERWKAVHPGLVTIPFADVADCSSPYGLLYVKNVGDDATRFLSCVQNLLLC